ncbi:hypothetical protein E4K72_12060 [Oxalobacteraceae bacterium OM1]|nr:hypothetical protein E4K72_12060 [Oxalobacteraceae bacterium OM1]
MAFAQIRTIVGNRCLLCHSATSGTRIGFNQSGLAFDSPAQIGADAPLMNAAIQARRMPLGNATNMTDAERATFNQWVMEGANINE